MFLLVSGIHVLYPQELIDEAIEEYKKNPNIEDIEPEVETKIEPEPQPEKKIEEKPVVKPGGNFKFIYIEFFIK